MPAIDYRAKRCEKRKTPCQNTLCYTLIIGCLLAFPGSAYAQKDSLAIERSIGGGLNYQRAVYTRDHKQAIIVYNDCKAYLIDCQRGDTILNYPGSWTNPSLSKSESDQWLSIIASDGLDTVSIFELKTGRLHTRRKFLSNCQGCDFSADEKYSLFSSTWGKTPVLLSLVTDSMESIEVGYYPAVSSDGSGVLSYSINRDTMYYHDRKGTFLWTKAFYAWDARFFPDGTLCLAKGRGLFLVDPATGAIMDTVAGSIPYNGNQVSYHMFPSTHDRMISYQNGDTIFVWNCRGDTLITRIKRPQYHNEIGFSSDGTDLYVENALSRAIVAWNARTGDSVGTVFAPIDHPLDRLCCKPRLSPDGAMIVSGSRTNSPYFPKLWDSKTGTVLRAYYNHPSIMVPRVSPDKTAILTAPDKKTVILWDAGTENVIMNFNTGISSTLWEWYDEVSAEFLNNSSTIFCEIGYAMDDPSLGAGYEKQVFWWNVATGNVNKSLHFPYRSKMSDLPQVYSSRDCSRYLVHGYDYRVYDLSNDSLLGSTEKSGLLCFTPDLSTAIFNDGTQRNFITNTESRWMDTNGAMIFDSAYCSPDNSKLLLLWSLGGGSRDFLSTAYVRVHNKNYRLASMNTERIIAPTGNPFSDDGNKLVVEYMPRMTYLFDLSVISGVTAPPEHSPHLGTIRLHSINHRELRFLIPPEYVKNAPEIKLNVYTLSGAEAASLPANRHAASPLQSFKLPDRLSSGTYIYRFENCESKITGKFLLMR